MIEKVWAIKGREEKVASNGNRYLQVTVAGDDGKDHKYNLYEQGMWTVFQNNAYVQVQLEKQEGEGKRWEVKSASSVANQLPTEEHIETELGRPLTKVTPEIKEENQPRDSFPQVGVPPPPAPQAIGMITKEIGDMIRAKYMLPIFGEEAQMELLRWYRNQVLGITRIPYDGAKLPKFEAQK